MKARSSLLAACAATALCLAATGEATASGSYPYIHAGLSLRPPLQPDTGGKLAFPVQNQTGSAQPDKDKSSNAPGLIPPISPGSPDKDKDKDDSETDNTAKPPAPPQIPNPVNRASYVLGMTVKNPQNQTLGRIRDVVFDLQSGRVSYIVLEKAGHAGTQTTGSDLAIPIDHFSPSADRKALILNADPQKLQGATGFSGENFPAMNNPAFGAQADQPVRREIYIVPVPVNPHGQEGQPGAPDEDSGSNTPSPTPPTPGHGPKIEKP